MKKSSFSLDIINTLPSTIIETVLCLLPIKDAVRTSILSKEWRYKWTNIHKLVFNEADMFDRSAIEHQHSDSEGSFEEPSYEMKELTRKSKLFFAIHHVLLMHDGPILEFTLSMDANNTFVEIDQIITYFSRNNTLKKFTVDLTYYDHYDLPLCAYKLPLSVFSLHQLTNLYLRNCDINHQTPFNGFGSLTSLYLEHVNISKKALLHLISKSPLITSFTLIEMEDNFEGDDSACDLFKYLPVIERLSVCMWSVEMIYTPPSHGIPQELPTALVHLKYVCLQKMCFFDQCNLVFIVLLMRISPSLEKFKLQISPEDNDHFKKSDIDSVTLGDYSDIWLNHLSELEIEDFTNLKPELELVKIILVKSALLKKVRISLYNKVTNDEELEMLKFLFYSPRASPLVEFIVERPPKCRP